MDSRSLRTRSLAWLALCAALAPATAAAATPVMEQVVAPWNPLAVTVTLVLVAVCPLLARIGRPAPMAAGGLVAVGWAALQLGTSELYDEKMGPKIQAALSADWFTAYQVLVPVEAVLPAVAFALAMAVHLNAMQKAARKRASTEDLDGLRKT